MDEMYLQELCNSLQTFYGQTKDNHRFLSWEYCYEAFYSVINKSKVEASNPKYAEYVIPKDEETKIDWLSMNLACYLSSWGMYRGSSFLLWKSYKVYIPVVREILNYSSLSDFEYAGEHPDELFKLIKTLKGNFKEIRKSVKAKETKTDISNILVSKILLGTLGCIPAYDEFFRWAVSSGQNNGEPQNNWNWVASGILGKNSFNKLVEFYRTNKETIKRTVGSFNTERLNLPYPPMKLVDMMFWQYGKINKQNKKNDPHPVISV